MPNFAKINNDQRKNLLGPANRVVEEFANGFTTLDNGLLREWGEFGGNITNTGAVLYTKEFIYARDEFTRAASKILRARSAHRKTIHNICQAVATRYVDSINADGGGSSEAILQAGRDLVDLVLAEAGREYVRIEPNFLVKHETLDQITIGRVRSMPTELAASKTTLSANPRVRLEVGDYPSTRVSKDGIVLAMPPSVWVIDVPATRENVGEEARWLIDVATSIMRLSSRSWSHRFPSVGNVEVNPLRPTVQTPAHVTIDGDTAFTGGGAYSGWYQANADVVNELNAPEIKSRAAILFDPTEGSLAERVAQGLGWMTRGRQQADRSERLLGFFTALEALLSSTDKSDPVTQTISRRSSVIFTSNIQDRVTVFKHIRALYSLRSSVVHSGSRVVLWDDVNRLQVYVETIYWLVLKSCDLSINQSRFAQSLDDASHGGPWEFGGRIP